MLTISHSIILDYQCTRLLLSVSLQLFLTQFAPLCLIGFLHRDRAVTNTHTCIYLGQQLFPLLTAVAVVMSCWKNGSSNPTLLSSSSFSSLSVSLTFDFFSFLLCFFSLRYFCHVVSSTPPSSEEQIIYQEIMHVYSYTSPGAWGQG